MSKAEQELIAVGLRCKTHSEPETRALLTGIHSKVVAATQLNNVEDKIVAQKTIINESNMMMLKF
jgi:hypothetical protein